MVKMVRGYCPELLFKDAAGEKNEKVLQVLGKRPVNMLYAEIIPEDCYAKKMFFDDNSDIGLNVACQLEKVDPQQQRKITLKDVGNMTGISKYCDHRFSSSEYEVGIRSREATIEVLIYKK